MSAVRRTEIQKAIKELDGIVNYTRMSPVQIAKLSEKWREVWIASPLVKVIERLEAELNRSVEKKGKK